MNDASPCAAKKAAEAFVSSASTAAHVASKSVHPGACGAYTSMCTTPSAIVFVFALADQLEPIAVYRLVVQSVRWGSSAAAPVDAFSRVDQVVRP